MIKRDDQAWTEAEAYLFSRMSRSGQDDRETRIARDLAITVSCKPICLWTKDDKSTWTALLRSMDDDQPRTEPRKVQEARERRERIEKAQEAMRAANGYKPFEEWPQESRDMYTVIPKEDPPLDTAISITSDAWAGRRQSCKQKGKEAKAGFLGLLNAVTGGKAEKEAFRRKGMEETRRRIAAQEIERAKLAAYAAKAKSQGKARTRGVTNSTWWSLYLTTVVGLVYAASLIPSAEAFIAYDCEHPDARYQKIDLREPAACPDPIKDYDAPENLTVHVLQTDNKGEIDGYQCRITTTKEVTRCGFNSITYGSQVPVWEQEYEITPRQCRAAIRTGKVSVHGITYTVEKGVQLKKSFYSHGNVEENGRCDVANFMTAGILFSSSYERTTVKIMIKVIRGVQDWTRQTVTFSNGVKHRLMDGIVRDAYEGTIIWTPREPECSETVSEIYLGQAAIHRRSNSTSLQGSIMMVNSASKTATSKHRKQYAGLILKEATSTCGTHCYTTQIDGVLACILREGDSPLPPATFKDNFRQETVNWQTQIGHQNIGNNLRIGARFETVQRDICELERKILSAGLQGLADGNKYALLDLFGKGSVAHTAGAIAYVTKCVQVSVGKATHPNCTNEIPVRENEITANRTRYADPLTLILRDYPTIIPCSDYMPPGYPIGDEWFCAHPETHTCQAPRKLQTTVSTYSGMGDFTEGMGQGVYSPEQREAHAAFQRAVSSRAAVVMKVTNSATHDGIIMDQLGYTLDGRDVDNLKFDLMGTYFPWVLWLGAAWPWLVGGCLVFSLVKMIVGSAIRIYITILQKGIGCWLIAAIWSTTFGLIGAPFRFASAAMKSAGEADPIIRPNEQQEDRRRPYRKPQRQVEIEMNNTYASGPRNGNPLVLPMPNTNNRRFEDKPGGPGLLPMTAPNWGRPSPPTTSHSIGTKTVPPADNDSTYGGISE